MKLDFHISASMVDDDYTVGWWKTEQLLKEREDRFIGSVNLEHHLILNKFIMNIRKHSQPIYNMI